MILTLIGIIDMQAFIGTDDTPFDGSSLFSRAAIKERGVHSPAGGAKVDIPRRPGAESLFKEEFHSAFGCDWLDVGLRRAESIFSHTHPLGDGIEIAFPDDSPFVEGIKETALGIMSDPQLGVYKYILLEDDRSLPLRKQHFDLGNVRGLLLSATMTLKFIVRSPGCIVMQIDIESGDPNFVLAWYPICYAIENTTYRKANYEVEFDDPVHDPDLESTDPTKRKEAERNRDDRREEALDAAFERVPHGEQVNIALGKFRTALANYLPETVPRKGAKKSDEVETGFYCLVRCSQDENWQEALKAVTAHNEYVISEPIRSDPYATYVGWTASCVVCDASEGFGDERVVADAVIAITVYNIFYFYETYLQNLLAEHVFSQDSKVSRYDLTRQRRFGDAVHFLGDLRRVSQYGSDRRFFDKWIEISGLDKLKQKTAEGLKQILGNLEDRHRKRTSDVAKLLGLFTFVIGFSSVLSWITSFQNYFRATIDTAKAKGALTGAVEMLPSHLVYAVGSTPEGRQVVAAYIAVITVLLSIYFLGSWFVRAWAAVETYLKDELPRTWSELTFKLRFALRKLRRLFRGEG